MNKHALAALVVGALSAPAFALDIPLANGGFELAPPTTGQFGFPTNWVVQTGGGLPGQFSGVFGTGGTYGSFVATEGSRYAMISNQGQAFTTLAQSLPIALLNMPFVCFNFIYLTTDAVGTTTPNLDGFGVVVTYYSDAQGTQQIGSVQPFVVDVNAIGGLSPLSGGIPNGPFNGAAVNASGPPGTFNRWIGMSVPLVNPTAPFARFTFVIDNLGTTTTPGISAVLLDDVRINPEPGTMALFGLGAAGLGAITWRRRRARLAAAAAK